MVIYNKLILRPFQRTFWYVLPPNYRSDPPDGETSISALLLNRRTYPPRDSWNFCGLRWGKSTKAKLGR
uniref:Uncharacterized protein n=1 Tax=Utricularia reniformis TaxID=192314 RepID=A0A1Y0AYQ2_9LAMI|nr:hypothetical protein AEK19_MT0447 [Utricularia reniformis]ART30285.1 hypothetical protein AEK19_MT0447 [Utricularia reniformis]